MYREDKSTQLAAYLLKKAGGHCNYLVLIKMMYDADRYMVLTWGSPIVYDDWYSMKNGPVLSSTLDAIGGDTKYPYWLKHIKTTNYDLFLINDPGDDALSDAELEAADKGYEDFKNLDYKQASKHSHDLFEEWQDPGSTSIRITFEDVLKVNGFTDPAYLDEVRTHNELNNLLAR